MDGPVRPRLASRSDFRFGAVPTETIEDALLHLAQQNEQAVQEAAGRMGSFRETRIVDNQQHHSPEFPPSSRVSAH